MGKLLAATATSRLLGGRWRRHVRPPLCRPRGRLRQWRVRHVAGALAAEGAAAAHVAHLCVRAGAAAIAAEVQAVAAAERLWLLITRRSGIAMVRRFADVGGGWCGARRQHRPRQVIRDVRRQRPHHLVRQAVFGAEGRRRELQNGMSAFSIMLTCTAQLSR